MKHRESLDELANRFPSSFVWGVASSAFQIEGASVADGKGASIWDEFCRLPGVIADGSDGRTACDHYNRLESDLDLIAGLGVGAYRFSISWPRIQPTGSGEAVGPGMDFYNRLVDGLLERDIQPFATLYHWDLPAALQREHGGWADRNTAYRFAEYAALVAERLGDRVRSFATHNEPWVTATIGHELGHFAPGIKNRAVAMQVSHHCLLSHGLAAKAMRSARSNLDVGIVLNLSPVYSATDSPADTMLAAREDGLLVRWYMDALLRGEYPADILEYLAADAPHVKDGDAQLIAEPLDFLGVNYYTRSVIRNDAVAWPVRAAAVRQRRATYTETGWEVYPRGLTDTLLWVKERYGDLPVYVTENGAAFFDPPTVDGDQLEDPLRVAYLRGHLRAIRAALEQGVDLRGYFVWSLLDNFEWALGYSKRFGIVHVDFETQRRTPKASARFYSGVIASNGEALNP